MTNDLQTRFDTLQNEHAKLRAALRDIEQIALDLDQDISPIDQLIMALNIAQTALAAVEKE